jgi:5-methylcytosine-specific restriction endonuclease McrA
LARIRTIKPEFPQSESMGRVSREERRHFRKASIPNFVRRAVFARYGLSVGREANIRCHYCSFVGVAAWLASGRLGWPTSPDLEMDHVEPEFHGGPTVAANIVLACRPCNRAKGSKRRQEWEGP